MATAPREPSRFVHSLTILEAAALGCYDDEATWRTWGPKGMRLPVGVLHRWAPPPLLSWSFAEWRRQGDEVGLNIKALQSPLYYFLMEKKIWDRNNSSRLDCSVRGCGKTLRCRSDMI